MGGVPSLSAIALATAEPRELTPAHFAGICPFMQTLTAIVYPTPDGKWFVAYNPETGTTTQGKNFDKAMASLKEATELYLSEFPVKSNGRAVLTTFEVAHA